MPTAERHHFRALAPRHGGSKGGSYAASQASGEPLMPPQTSLTLPPPNSTYWHVTIIAACPDASAESCSGSGWKRQRRWEDESWRQKSARWLFNRCRAKKRSTLMKPCGGGPLRHVTALLPHRERVSPRATQGATYTPLMHTTQFSHAVALKTFFSVQQLCSQAPPPPPPPPSCQPASSASSGMPWNSAMLASTPSCCRAVACRAHARLGVRWGPYGGGRMGRRGGLAAARQWRAPQPSMCKCRSSPRRGAAPPTGGCVPRRCPPHTSQLCCRWLVATEAHFMHRMSCSW